MIVFHIVSNNRQDVEKKQERATEPPSTIAAREVRGLADSVGKSINQSIDQSINQSINSIK